MVKSTFSIATIGQLYDFSERKLCLTMIFQISTMEEADHFPALANGFININFRIYVSTGEGPDLKIYSFNY